MDFSRNSMRVLVELMDNPDRLQIMSIKEAVSEDEHVLDLDDEEILSSDVGIFFL